MCPKTHLLVYMKLTNINDNLSNYIFQASVKLSLVVSSVKVGSCHTLEQERFCWEIWEKGSFRLHSLRSGGATAAGNEVPERLIQKHGRWKVESPKTGTYTSFTSENVANKYDKRIHLYFSFMAVYSILVARSLLSISWLLAHTIFLLVLFDCK